MKKILVLLAILYYTTACADDTNEVPPPENSEQEKQKKEVDIVLSFAVSDKPNSLKHNYYAFGGQGNRQFPGSDYISTFVLVTAFAITTGEDNLEDDYYGFGGEYGARLNLPITPYVSIGALAGENKLCSETSETCSRENFVSVYPNVGVIFQLSKKFHLKAYYRRYYMSDPLSDFSAKGLGIGYRL